MSRDILGEYGHDMPKASQVQPAHPRQNSSPDGDGGLSDKRDVMNYAHPQIPGGYPMHHCAPGLHANNLGNCGTQQASRIKAETSGSPGIGGRSVGHGTNRKG
jgi:hypothetical protein